MLCENCKKRLATIHLKQIINDNKIEMHLCIVCADYLKQDEALPLLNFEDFFTGLLGGSITKSCNSLANKPDICEVCDMSFEEFKKTGKVGCANCYYHFKEKIEPVLKRLHGNIQHFGKVPVKLNVEIKKDLEIDLLKQQLCEAVKNEQYEKAAQIRDAIKDLERNKGAGELSGE